MGIQPQMPDGVHHVQGVAWVGAVTKATSRAAAMIFLIMIVSPYGRQTAPTSLQTAPNSEQL